VKRRTGEWHDESWVGLNLMIRSGDWHNQGNIRIVDERLRENGLQLTRSPGDIFLRIPFPKAVPDAD